MKIKQVLALVLALLLICSIGTVAIAAEDDAATFRAPACACGGAYVAKERYWDYDNYLNWDGCIYGSGRGLDYYIVQREITRCNRCGDVYSELIVNYSWYCPNKGVFYTSR